MQDIGGATYNPANGDFHMATSVAARGGKVILHNLSAYDLKLTFNSNSAQTDTTRRAFLLAWQQREFNFVGKQTDDILVQVYGTPPQAVLTAAPSSYVFGEAYAPGEPTPVSYPNYDRLSNVGNTVTTQGGSSNVKNDGNTPGTSIIESTPSDQASSSVSINNDASGYLQVLSANVLRKILNVVRGNNGSTKAQVTLGDSGDPSILTIYGSLAGGGSAPIADALSARNNGNSNDGFIAIWDSVNVVTDLGLGNGQTTQSAIGLKPMNSSGVMTRVLQANSDGSIQFNVSGVAWNAAGSQTGGTIPAARVQPGTFASGSTVWDFPYDVNVDDAHALYFGGKAAPPSNVTYIGRGVASGATSDRFELGSIGRDLDIILGDATHGIWFKWNNYNNGTNDVFAAAGWAYQINIGANITASGGQPLPGIRWSTASGAAGGTITWGSWQQLIFGWYATTAPSLTGVPASALWINSSI